MTSSTLSLRHIVLMSVIQNAKLIKMDAYCDNKYQKNIADA